VGKFHGSLGEELSLHVRHLAWLNTAPREEGKRTLASRKPDDAPATRKQKMSAEDRAIPLPPCSAPCFVEWLLDAGPTEPGGMGEARLSWRSLRAWEDGAGIRLDPWQRRLLRRLSGDWLAESDRARKVDCPPPWQPDAGPIDRPAVSSKIQSMFRGRIARAKERATA
jgi:hypothetical protein